MDQLSRMRLGLAVLAIPFSIPSAVLAQAPGGPPPPAVTIERISVREVSNPQDFTARVEAIETVDIRARIQGFLYSIDFEEGKSVKAGDTLFEIEPDQVEAAVASERAQVARAEATLKASERTLARTRELFQQRTTPQSNLDQAQAAFDIARANVEVAKASLRAAELNLSYAHITAPISGEIGRAALTVGNLVGPESGPLARIVSLDPIRVAFSMTEGFLITLRQQESNGGAIDPNAIGFRLRLANGTIYDETGRIDYVENEIDPQTGTAAVRVIFPNPDSILLPGQFVSIEVTEPDAPILPIVPQTAVLQDREGHYVFMLGNDNVVSQRRIETGARVDNGWAVTKGLAADEVVVVQGIQRLRDGMTVQPSEAQPAGGG
jgi:membrane fusion protein (multidrug efflux system)